MEKQLIKKVCTVSFMIGAVIAWVTTGVLFKTLAGSFGVVQRVYGNEVISHGLPVLVAVLVFSLLQFNARSVLVAEEVVLEVSKVVWPSRKDTFGMTMVVIVMVFIASIVLMAVDTVAREVIRVLIELPTYFS